MLGGSLFTTDKFNSKFWDSICESCTKSGIFSKGDKLIAVKRNCF